MEREPPKAIARERAAGGRLLTVAQVATPGAEEAGGDISFRSVEAFACP